MTLTINDTTITSDQNPHTARQAPGRPPQWEVSWLPGQAMDRNTATTAMVLADLTGQDDLHEGHRLWPHIQGWAAELGLTGPDAIARTSEPPRHLGPGQERASGQPDRGAGQLTSQPDTASRSPGTSAERWAALTGPQPEPEADERDEPEWDSQNSNAYQARVEAGLEPEAGS
jgi:hypothetical protein